MTLKDGFPMNLCQVRQNIPCSEQIKIDLGLLILSAVDSVSAGESYRWNQGGRKGTKSNYTHWQRGYVSRLQLSLREKTLSIMLDQAGSSRESESVSDKIAVP